MSKENKTNQKGRKVEEVKEPLVLEEIEKEKTEEITVQDEKEIEDDVVDQEKEEKIKIPQRGKNKKEKQGVVEKDGLLPFHYFPARESAFMWVAFPVLFEINKVQRESGDDWQDLSKFEDSKYKKEIKTLLYLVQNYDNIEIQESRNGYILSKEELIAGHFYNDI